MRVKTDARFTQAGLRLFGALVLSVCATIVLTLPTPALPAELPSLVVSTRVESMLDARDRARGDAAPDDRDARALEALVADAGRREARRLPPIDDEESRAFSLRRRIVASHGPRSIAALRSRAVTRMLESFDPSREVHGEPAARIGGFRVALVAWNAIVHDRLVAPAFVVRVLYAARWNVICRLPPTSGFGREELRAYYGWFALHAEDARPERRLDALRRFAALGDARDRLAAAEATATLLARHGDPLTAASLYDHAAEGAGTPRLRNFARGALLRAR